MDYFDGDHHSERDEQFGKISLRVLDLRPVCRVRKAQRQAAVGERDSRWVPDATLDLPIAIDSSWHYLTDPDPFCLARWSRWVRRVHRCPPAGSDPSGYLDVVRRLLDNDRCDVLLPTHEHAWLSSVARERLGPGVGLAVASPSAFAGVQSKIEFARLLDEVGLRQPAWSIVRKSAMSWTYPCYLKAPFSTAGRGVRMVRNDAERSRALVEFGRVSSELMVQAPVSGVYCQVQALFDHGRLLAAHTSQQRATGLSGSAAARISVDHKRPR